MALSISYSRIVLAGGEFQTNTYTFVDQLAPEILGLPNGGFVSAYNNITLTGGIILLNFYDNLFDPPEGHAIPFDNADSKAHGQPSLTQLANGNVLVVWDDNDPADLGIKGHLFASSGNEIGDELDLSAPLIGEEDPQVMALPGGGFVVGHVSSGCLVPTLRRCRQLPERQPDQHRGPGRGSERSRGRRAQ